MAGRKRSDTFPCVLLKEGGFGLGLCCFFCVRRVICDRKDLSVESSTNFSCSFMYSVNKDPMFFKVIGEFVGTA